MNNLPTIFNFEETQVRVVTVNEEPWFVAIDVAVALDMARSTLSEAVNGKKRRKEDGSVYFTGGLDEDEKGFVTVETQGGPQNVLAVSESGLYALVHFSSKPEAKAFQRWIRKEVIPSIRKTGSYSIPKNNVIPLDERQVRMELLKSAIDHEERLGSVEQELSEVKRQVQEQIALQHHEQRALQKAINRRVLDLAGRSEFQQLGFDEQDRIHPDLNKVKRRLYSQLHRSVKDAFAVASYRDIRRCDFQEAMKYVEAWRPRLAA